MSGIGLQAIFKVDIVRGTFIGYIPQAFELSVEVRRGMKRVVFTVTHDETKDTKDEQLRKVVNLQTLHIRANKTLRLQTCGGRAGPSGLIVLASLAPSRSNKKRQRFGCACVQRWQDYATEIHDVGAYQSSGDTS